MARINLYMHVAVKQTDISLNVTGTDLVPARNKFTQGNAEAKMTNQNSPKSTKLSKSGDSFAKKPLRDKIGGNLRQIYDEVVNEPVPDDFLALLAKADEADDPEDTQTS